ncbi:acetyltransferase [Muricoccus pecuniae]|uniref:UDP-perosamine 4-acetyltransferase n=1 Tax=Muricoccus pecuniae TaxID=693023 RepID=A0A840Y4Q0_9PROT|nr:acetyltransferase [Roseomonas pecuniae]MBB5695136.1 UDP-perosamine 4-acetyltransferase [Roseomonas pecuniae]
MPDLPRPQPPRVVIIGAGGHAKVIIEALRAAGFPSPLGLIDPRPAGETVLGVAVLGGDEMLEGLRTSGAGAAVVALGNNALRLRVGDKLVAMGFSLPPLVHPAAQLSPSAELEEGAVVMARACLGPDARIGRLAIVNTNAVVEHDNRIGQAAHVAPGCALAGNVTVGDRALVGVGSAVRPGITIGADAVIGAGSAVVRDVPPDAVVAGAPARSLSRGA